MSFTECTKISGNDSTDAVVVLRGLGTEGEPDERFASLLVQQGFEVHFFDRKGDDFLIRSPNAIARYCRAIRKALLALQNCGKRVHILGISHGGFLAMEVARDVRLKLASLVLLASLIDPHTVMSKVAQNDEATGLRYVYLQNGLRLPILSSVIESIRGWMPEFLTMPTLAIMGEADEFENHENLDRILGAGVSTQKLPGVTHAQTTGHLKTQRLLQQFYARILTEMNELKIVP